MVPAPRARKMIAHRFNGGYAIRSRSSPPGDDTRISCGSAVMPGPWHSVIFFPLSQRSTTPTRTKAARFGDPDESLGFLISSRKRDWSVATSEVDIETKVDSGSHLINGFGLRQGTTSSRAE